MSNNKNRVSNSTAAGSSVLSLWCVIVTTTLLLASSESTAQDNPADACEEAARLVNEDNDIDGALDEARWCVESLEQIKEQQAMSVFPDAVGEFVGGETENQKAFGMSMIERSYNSGSVSIDLSLTGGGAAGAGLAALAQMSMKMGAQGGQKIRIQRRTVIDMGEAGSPAFLVQLRSGGILNVTSSTADRDTVLAFLNEFPIAELDDALKQ